MTTIDSRWYELRNLVNAGHFAAAQAIVAKDPDVIRLRNGIGETVMHFLAVENALGAVAWLHAKGSDLDTKNAFGSPVIFEVAQLGYQDLYDWFIANGADANAHDASGNTLSEYLREFGGGLDS